MLSASAATAAAQGRPGASLDPQMFVNPIGEGADPWVVRDPNADRYLWCFSEGNRAIAIHTSERLTSLGRKHIVWQAPADGPFSKEVWAPELHFLDGRWHVYFAASNGQNKNHLAYVLKSETKDPLGNYELHGPLATGDGTDGQSPNVWAIDMTVLEHGGKRYAIWSGWDAPGTDRQFLYIAPMKLPTELAGPRVRLCGNLDFGWERTEPASKGRGLNEAPQVFQIAGQTFVTYSCGASWLPNYKLGKLELTGADPLDPWSWKKHDRPAFEATEETYGVGHSCFVKSPDGSQWWHVFHAKRDRQPGWRRAVYVQPMKVDKHGMPELGAPLSPLKPLERPAGEKIGKMSQPYQSSLKRPEVLASWSYFGHHQFFKQTDRGLELGQPPAAPINDYRCGEKVVLDAPATPDFTAEVTIDFLGDAQARDAGILFRTTGASLGYDAQRGYFAGVVPKSGLVILGKTDGSKWTEIARASAALDTTVPQRLRVEAVGDRITIGLDGRPVLAAHDATYSSGAVGLRVVNSHAVFSDLRIE